MNEEKLKSKINSTIENKNLCKYLLSSLKSECKLNSLSSLSFLIEKALERFENKIKVCQQIEKDLPDKLIVESDLYLLSEKLNILRLKLAILYADGVKSEIVDEHYNEIKDFILKILTFDINLKLKYFDLTIKLLEKITGSRATKEYISALDLLKLFANEPKNHPNKLDLKYISSLWPATHEENIRKCFYGIVYELDKKLLFKSLLDQLLEILENYRNSLFKFIGQPSRKRLIEFNIKFITNCFADPEMDAVDLWQLISLVCATLEHSNEELKTKTFLEKINARGTPIDIIKFKKDRE